MQIVPISINKDNCCTASCVYSFNDKPKCNIMNKLCICVKMY